MKLKAGTYQYFAPELFDLEHSFSPATDVWALGLSIYVLLTGKLPFSKARSLCHLAEIVKTEDIDFSPIHND